MSHGHEQAIEVLDRELHAVRGVLNNLTDADWQRSTRLIPEGEGLQPWRLADLVAHIDISIGLTLGLLDTIQTGQPGRDRASFFIADRSTVAPVVYAYAVQHAAQNDRASLVERTRSTFDANLAGIRTHPLDTIGSGFFALRNQAGRPLPVRIRQVVQDAAHGVELSVEDFDGLLVSVAHDTPRHQSGRRAAPWTVTRRVSRHRRPADVTPSSRI